MEINSLGALLLQHNSALVSEFSRFQASKNSAGPHFKGVLIVFSRLKMIEIKSDY